MTCSTTGHVHGTRRFRLALLILAGVAGCNESLTRPRTGKEVPSAGSPSIVDANHSGNSHFFFLPPLITGLSQGAGTSDGAQRPNVVVCELKTANGQSSCGAIIAQFARRNDGGPGDISYDATTGAYQTNWSTDECMSGPCALDVNKTYRLRVLIGAYELGHADLDVVNTGKELRNVQTGEYIGLVNGRTLPIRFRIEQGALSLVPNGGSVTVGAEGGVLTNGAGTVALDFQNGSLSSAKSISISDVTEPMLGDNPFSHPVQLGPDGTTFDKPVTLTMAFDGSKVPPGVPFDKLAILVWKGDSWDVVPNSVVNTVDNTVSASISHFSMYTVGMGFWTPTNQPSTQEIVVGQTTRVYAVTTAYDVAPATYCDTVHVQDSSGTWVYEPQCTTVSEQYTYTPVGLRVSYFTSDPGGWNLPSYWVQRFDYTRSDAFVYGYIPLDPSNPVYPPGSTIATFDAPGYGVVQSGTIQGYSGVAPSPTLRGVAPGTAFIWTLTGDQLTGPWVVVVHCADPATLSIAPASAQLSTVAPNNTVQLSATPRDAAGNVVGCATTTWTSADDNVATVDANGLVTAHTSGTTTITAKSGTTTVATATASITVSAPGYSLLFDEGDPSTMTTQIVVQSADGQSRSTVTSYNLGGSGIGSMARFSPDGTKIIYQKATPQNGDLFFVNPADGSQRQLTFNAGLNAGAVFSPNGDRILFLSTRTGNYELWMMDGNGNNQTQLTHTAPEDSPGSFSPTGSQIAFTRGNGSGRDVWVSSAVPDNSPSYTSHQVTAVGGQMSNVRWSPDGTKLLVVREGTLYTINPTAQMAPLSAMTPIPTGGHSPLAPDWSSDGKKIVFAAGNEWVIYTMNADGTDLQKVPTPVALQENFASFKPGDIFQLPPSHATLSGSLFFDLDQNGVFDPVDEVGLSGWTVQLTGPVTRTMLTDGDGAYSFAGLTDGDYQVCVIAPAGWTQTTPDPSKTPATTTCAAGRGYGYYLTVPVLASDVTYSGFNFGWVSQ